jgi:general secretion pathway protein G
MKPLANTINVTRSHRAGFSLVEMMVVVSIIGILTAIAVPKFNDIQRKSRESALRTDLQVYRSAIYVFYSDTGLYPATLSDLAARTAPSTGLKANGATRSLVDTSWRGPYVESVRFDPVSDQPFQYFTAAGSVGTVKPSAPGNDSNGTPFSDY